MLRESWTGNRTLENMKYEMGKGRNIGGASVFYFMHAENILKPVSSCLQPLSKLFHENSEL